MSYYGDSDIGQHIDNLLGLGLGLDYGKAKWGIAQEVNFEYLFRQFDRWVLKYDGEFYINGLFIKPHYYRVNTDSFEYFDYLRIGGASDIRGYLEEEFIVSRAMWVNIEYKRFFLFPLFDIGRLGDEIQFSYGFGIEAKSDFANASLILAWPKNGHWRDGKIHLMFEKGF